MNPGKFTSTDWLLFCGISAVWGASFLFIDIGLDSLEPGLITLLRVGLGALTLLVAVSAGGKGLGLPDAEDRRTIALLGLIWVAVPFTIFPLAQEHVNSAIAGLLNGATPIFATLIAARFLGQRTRGTQLLGILVGFIGILLISAPSVDDGSSQTVGVAMILAATVLYGFSMNIAPPLQQKYGSVQLMAWVLAVATVLTLPFGLAGIGGSSFEWGPIAAVAFLGVAGTGLAYAMLGSLVGRVGGPRGSIITYAIPVVALVLGTTFRDDQVSRLAVLGVLIVMAGAYLASRSTD